ncbi:SRPBCC domain-containing protein [Sphingomonas trueperi]|uniref:SRPBCC domain-containing protein n=1 Tax=Sphingomonas trueperi TaxID=53317 RepID=UPI000EB08C87
MPVTHDTFQIRKICDATPPAVFSAFAFQDRKSRWYAASTAHEPLSYSFDFRPGGEEKLTARMRPGTPIAGKELCWTSTYAEIADNARIVFFQTLDVDQARVSAAVVTVEIAALGDQTEVLLTHQAVYFEGADGPAMRRMGWDFLIDTMASELQPA